LSHPTSFSFELYIQNDQFDGFKPTFRFLFRSKFPSGMDCGNAIRHQVGVGDHFEACSFDRAREFFLLRELAARL